YLVDYAHAVIDAGADAVIGHHPHIPQGIEIYKGNPVFYSLGNTVCGFYNKKYTNNFLAALRIKGIRCVTAEIIPISGDNSVMQFSPRLLEGEDSSKEIARIVQLSAPFGTRITDINGRGVIYLPDGRR
ncbi:MAG: CapA family protein, partial [Spirochaetota bacterium]